jgi:membrane protein YqaA with SNARE-associated domain
MIAAFLATVATGFASAFIPAIPVEPYIVGLMATTEQNAVLVGIAAGIGQTVGKLLIFLGVRGLINAPILQRWLGRRAKASPPAESAEPETPTGGGVGTKIRTAGVRLTALLDRPALSAPIVLLSATVGLPPLLLVSAYAARTRMTVGMFTATCLLGRSIRFVAIAFAPQLIMS